MPVPGIKLTNAPGSGSSGTNPEFAWDSSCFSIPALLPERERPVNLSEMWQFLRSIPELKDLTLSTRTNELESIVEANNLYLKKTVSKKDMTYWLLTPAGENVVVMFGDDGDCHGVQRLSPIPTNSIKQTIGESEYQAWMDKRKSLKLEPR